MYRKFKTALYDLIIKYRAKYLVIIEMKIHHSNIMHIMYNLYII